MGSLRKPNLLLVLLVLPCLAASLPTSSWQSVAAAGVQHLQQWATSHSIHGLSWHTQVHADQQPHTLAGGVESSRHHRRTMLQDQKAEGPAADDAKDPTKRDTWDTEPSYSSHYSSDDERPNMCKVAHKIPAPLGKQQYNFTDGQKDYIPYIGTSLVRDSQLMLMRLYYSIDYPVKWFVVVVGQQAASGKNAIAYEVKHLIDYPQDKVGIVIITCEHQPAVSESWNAIFQTFKDEPWGVYMARDTFWEWGALEKLSPHGWEAAETGNVDVGYVKWSNMGEREAIHNIFVLTSKCIKRFGLFDENIYPALCEDIDMFRRAKIMDPPLKEHQWLDVLAVHGKRTDTSYWPGAWLPDDPNVQEEKELTHLTVHVRHGANCNYFMRKWGCPSEAGNWMAMTDDCKVKTPFNKSVPHWYWHTNKALRSRDRWLSVKGKEGQPKHLLDTRSNEVIFEVPKHYGEWGGYFEKTRMCRLSGYLGRVKGPDGRTMCL